MVWFIEYMLTVHSLPVDEPKANARLADAKRREAKENMKIKSDDVDDEQEQTKRITLKAKSSPHPLCFRSIPSWIRESHSNYEASTTLNIVLKKIDRFTRSHSISIVTAKKKNATATPNSYKLLEYDECGSQFYQLLSSSRAIY